MGATKSTETKEPATLSRDGTGEPRPFRFHLKQRDNGFWYVHVYRPDIQRTIPVTLRTKDEGDAKKQVAKWEKKSREQVIALLEKEEIPAPTDTLTAAADWYVKEHLAPRGRSEKTLANVARPLQAFCAFAADLGVSTVAGLTSKLLHDWESSLPDSPTARHDALTALRRCLTTWAKVHTRTLPALDWDIPARARSQRFRALSVAQTDAILAALQTRPDLLLPVCWMLETGWLVGDTVALRRESIHGEAGDQWVNVVRQKTGNPMAYPVTARMRGILDAGAPEGVVFRKASGQPWTADNFKSAFYAFLRKRGIKATSRDFRNTFATRKREAHCRPEVLSALMGHKDPTIALKHYVRVDGDAMRAGAEL